MRNSVLTLSSIVKTLKRCVISIAVLIVIFWLLPLLVQFLELALVSPLSAAIIAGYVILAIGMLFLFWIMAEAGYRVFLRPSLRARRIQRIRSRRLFREATDRNHMVQ